MRLLLYAMLSLLWVGCGGGINGGNTGDNMQPVIVVDEGEAILPVNLIVIRRSDMSGNDLWSKEYIDEFLDQATALTGRAVVFQKRSVYYFADDGVYSIDRQESLLSLATSYVQPRVLTVVVSQPETVDFVGATTQPAKQRNNPFLVMRSRHTDWSGVSATATILLHELGHNMALNHKPEEFLDTGAMHTDDWWLREDGLQAAERYVRMITK